MSFCEPKVSGDLPGEYIDESYLDDFIEQELEFKCRYFDESCILSVDEDLFNNHVEL